MGGFLLAIIDKNAYFRRKLALESGRKLKRLGILQSFLYLLAATNDSVFKSAPLFWDTLYNIAIIGHEEGYGPLLRQQYIPSRGMLRIMWKKVKTLLRNATIEES